jgi:hypothetical protein
MNLKYIFISVNNFPYEDYLKVSPHVSGPCLLSNFYGPVLNFREEFQLKSVINFPLHSKRLTLIRIFAQCDTHVNGRTLFEEVLEGPQSNLKGKSIKF